MQAICTNCGAEFPQVAPGTETCVCGGELLLMEDDLPEIVIPPERKDLLQALIPQATDSKAIEALDTVVKVINHEAVPSGLARRAVGQVLGNYEQGILTVLVGTARARTERLIKLLKGMSLLEDLMLDPAKLAEMRPDQQLKLYRTLQVSFTGDVDMLTNVVEMRARIESMLAHGMPLQQAQDDLMDDTVIKALPPAKRERLRTVLGRVIKAVQEGADGDADER